MQETDDLKSAIERHVEDTIESDVRIQCYDQGGVLDVHVELPALKSELESLPDDREVSVSVYSDLKFTVNDR